MRVPVKRGPQGLVRPFIPAGASGLLPGLASAVAGSSGPLDDWERESRPILESAILRWTRDVAAATEIVQDIRIAGLRCVRTGVLVSSECGWMSGVAGRSRLRGWARDRRSGKPLSGEVVDGAPGHEASFDDEVGSGEFRAALRGLFFAHPPPYDLALFLHHLSGWTVRQVAEYLHAWNGLSVEGTRRVLREGRLMAVAVMAGEDAVCLWPSRFLRKSRWTTTSPPFLDALYEERKRSGR